ncbi:MAG: hypothetical protein C0477_12155 [Delftia sp.]|nr:hypothetical protein [Delftia sp.]
MGPRAPVNSQLRARPSKPACPKARDTEQGPPRSEGVVPPRKARGGKARSDSGGLLIPCSSRACRARPGRNAR